MKKVCAILMISASVLGMVPSNAPIFTALTEAATDEKIQKLYAEATALLVKQSSVLSSEEKQIIC